jgi:ankyrin repeat protein
VWQQGKSALVFAVDYGHSNVVKLLLEHNAEANTADKVNNRPFY